MSGVRRLLREKHESENQKSGLLFGVEAMPAESVRTKRSQTVAIADSLNSVSSQSMLNVVLLNLI